MMINIADQGVDEAVVGKSPHLVQMLSGALREDVHFLTINRGDCSYCEFNDGDQVIRSNEETLFDDLVSGKTYAVESNGAWYVGTIQVSDNEATMTSMTDHPNVFEPDASFYEITHHIESFEDLED